MSLITSPRVTSLQPISTKTTPADTTLIEDEKSLSPERDLTEEEEITEEEITEEEELTHVKGKKSKGLKSKVVKFNWQSKRQSGRLRRRLNHPITASISNESNQKDESKDQQNSFVENKKSIDQNLLEITKSKDQDEVEVAKLKKEEDSSRVEAIESIENVAKVIENSVSKEDDANLVPTDEEVNLIDHKELSKESEEFLRRYDLLRNKNVGPEQKTENEHQENHIHKSIVSPQDYVDDQQENSRESLPLSDELKVEGEVPSPVLSDLVSREEVDDIIVVCQDSDDDDEDELMETSPLESPIVEREVDAKDVVNNSNIDNTDNEPVSKSSPLPLSQPDNVEDVNVLKDLDVVDSSSLKKASKETELELHSKAIDENERDISSSKPQHKTESLSFSAPPFDVSACTNLVAEIQSVDSSTVQLSSKSGKEKELKKSLQVASEKSKGEQSTLLKKDDEIKTLQTKLTKEVASISKNSEKSPDKKAEPKKSPSPSKTMANIELRSSLISATLSQAPTTSQAKPLQQQQSLSNVKKEGGNRLSQRFKYSKFGAFKMGTRLTSLSSSQQKCSDTSSSAAAKTEDAVKEREQEVQESVPQRVEEEKKLGTEEDVKTRLHEDEEDDHEDIDFCIEPTGKSAFYLLPAASISAAVEHDSEDSEVEILDNLLEDQELEDPRHDGFEGDVEDGVANNESKINKNLNDGNENVSENSNKSLAKDVNKKESMGNNDESNENERLTKHTDSIELDNRNEKFVESVNKTKDVNENFSEDVSKTEAADLISIESVKLASINHAASELKHVEDKQDKHNLKEEDDKVEETVTIKQNNHDEMLVCGEEEDKTPVHREEEKEKESSSHLEDCSHVVKETNEKQVESSVS